MNKSSEDEIHSQTVNYLKTKYPHVRFRTGLEGLNMSKWQAIYARRLQWGSGAPDLEILESCNGHSGLFLELKATNPFKKNGQLRAGDHLIRQQSWHTYMIKNGWIGGFCVGFDEAKSWIDVYLRDYSYTKLEDEEHPNTITIELSD